MKKLLGLALLLCTPLVAQVPAATSAFAPLQFLLGTWTADAAGPGGTVVRGKYTFAPELNGTVLARHSTEDSACKGPVSFDCAHRDLLYVFRDGAALRAIYFDSEGHTLHYTVTNPTPTTAEFLSDPSVPGPQFRLVYEKAGERMQGRFQMRMPGAAEWRSYLEWSGARLPEAGIGAK